MSDAKPAIRLQAARTVLQFDHAEREYKEVTRKIDLITEAQDLIRGR